MIKHICIAGVILSMAGCATAPEPTLVVLDNKEKDAYINKIEQVISDAGAGIQAVLEVTPRDSIAYAVLEAQGVRLGGIKPPTIPKLAEQRAIVANKDVKSAEVDKVNAQKVDEETSALWERVESLDSELAIANAAKELAIEEKARAVKERILFMVTSVGLFIATIGVMIVAFTSKKIGGSILIVSGGLAVSCAWIFDSEWFHWIAGIGVGLIVGDLLFIMVKKTIDFLRTKKTGQNENDGHIQ